jgi:hypothetical protein
MEKKAVNLVVLDQGINTTTIYGRLQFNILAEIGEFERGSITERSRERPCRYVEFRIGDTQKGHSILSVPSSDHTQRCPWNGRRAG